MSDDPVPRLLPEEVRVLLLPPTSRDATALQAVLQGAAIASVVCPTLGSLCEAATHGAGAIVVAETALIEEPDALAALVRAQPVWSDLPIVILSRAGLEPPNLAAILPSLGNVTVLERPMRATTLLSVVRSVLRARERQYLVRNHLERLRRADEELAALLRREQAARAEVERANHMKDEFLATLSHELRTPLNAILGWAQLLARDSHNVDRVAEGLRVIERNARAQAQIIEDLLDMSRIVSGKVRLDVQQTDLASVIGIAIESVRPAAEAKDIRLQAVLDPAAGPVPGDPDRLQQIFWNLLTNAIKFTPRLGKVEILLERVDSRVEVHVSDTGTGISADFLPHVFDRFRQADSSTTRRQGGLGLGLAIVKELVELHGGTVGVRSAGAAQGSTFTVTLPVAPVPGDGEPDRALVRREAVVGSTVGNADSARCPSIAGLHVLVVDDDQDARGVLRHMLEERGASVQTAGSVTEAMAVVGSAAHVDVLVSDIGMPNEDGYSLIKRIRQLEKSRGGRLPAMAVTAYAQSEDRTRAIAAGYQVHVAKPVEPVELIKMVARLAGRTDTA